MKKLIIVVIAAAIVWSGYWFVGAHFLNNGLARGLDDLRRAGWTLNEPDYSVRGFPNRFDTTFSDVDVVSPDGTAIQAAFFQILALSYKPNQIIAALPPRITMQGPAGEVTFTNEKARGSVTLQTAPSLPLDHATFVIDKLRVDTESESLSMDQLRVATRIPEGAPDARHQNVGVIAANVALPRPMQERLSAKGLGEVEQIRLDTTLDFAAPIDRTALESLPVVDRIDLHDLSFLWGGIELSGNGLLEVGADGRPQGTIDLLIENWRTALDIAVSIGLFAEDRQSQIERVLSFFGDGDDLEVSLDFRNGLTMLGPLPIGPAPRLR
ncbi:DUF2125 domain-containing protein [Maribius pontilimi]|uniref:DUF2125 domain-containing protein n=1 Tax=Palleronia pontilimi TaxID=1964209 RepID=A0A934MEF3_9RHOB|nr:DUF2125 domain-containing protein [Palleronia pontilimi]MBJ3763396.1 DUF2125 domain-containing protein [Palleronia pontilimi]